jgi:hypothetical protein
LATKTITEVRKNTPTGNTTDFGLSLDSSFE